MSYDTIERSLDDGQPIRLYSFALGGTVWRYTASAFDITAGGHTWLAAAISDDGVKQSGEATSDALGIDCSINLGPVQLHLQTAPSLPIKVRIYEMQRDNVTINQKYSGEISQVDTPTPSSARITCETLSASMRRQGLRLGWQRTCPYALYDPLTCKVDKAAFAVAGVVIAVGDGTLTVDFASLPADGYFNGGFIEWTLPVRGVDYRSIETQTGDVLTMFGPVDVIYPGLGINVYPGCDLTSETCNTKFGNILNNGAFKYMPGKSPFDGTPVF